MRVLVVEDEVRKAALIRRGLAEDGYGVDVATNGPDGLWQAQEFDYDAIVLDVTSPGIEGLEVCRRLRESGRRSPVLMLTARAAVDDRVEGVNVGADDYLAEPFSCGELAARVRVLFRRRGVDRPMALRVGDLVLDPARRRAWRRGDELTLSSKEFSLLEFFLRHPDRVLARTMILEHVWDFAYDGVSNVVDQYVCYFRRKIDEPHDSDLLETVRGAGYRLRIAALVPTASAQSS